MSTVIGKVAGSKEMGEATVTQDFLLITGEASNKAVT